MLLATGVLFTGCAGMKANKPPLTFTPHAFPAGQYTQKVDNVLFILDASNSMTGHGDRKFMTEKNIVSAINRSLPTDLSLNAGLRTFGHAPQQSENSTDLVYGMTHFTRDGFQQGLDDVKYAGGSSPMQEALEAAGSDLKGAQGPTAIIFVGDGLANFMRKGAPEAAAKLKAEMGNQALHLYHRGRRRPRR